MKSRATELIRIPPVALVLLTGCLTAFAQSNQCEYTDASGGTITCEKGQIPVCMMKDGRAIGMCKSPSSRPETSHLAAPEQGPVAQYLSVEVHFIGWEGGVSSYNLANSLEGLRLQPEWYSHYSLGSSLIKVGKSREAEKEFRVAELLATKISSPYMSLGVAASLHGQGVALFRQGKYAEAEAIFLGIIQSSKGSNLELYIRAYYSLAIALAAQKKYSQAEYNLRELIRLRATYPDALVFLGTILLEVGKLEVAKAEFRKAMEVEDSGRSLFEPISLEANEGLFVILLKQEKYMEAEALIGRLRTTKSQAWPAFRKGLLMLSERQYAAAELEFFIALRLEPNSPLFREALKTVKPLAPR